jgi:hypothetical protein
MKKLVYMLIAAHPAGGWFRKETAGTGKKRPAKNTKHAQSPDSFHTRAGFKKKDNPRPNPAP